MSDDTFFMAWNPSRSAPNYKHSSYQEAKREAERLSRNTPGEKFFVLQAVSLTRKVDIETKMLTQPDEIPF